MLTFNPNKGNCTGCAACYSVCPTHCISMDADEEGFLYPNASDACIHCGKCEEVCPAVLQKVSNNYIQKAVAAVSKDYGIWKRSSSGGAFSEICRQWADDDTLIVGAAWDGLKVHHVGVKGFENVAPLCKSKYISSAIEDTFIEMKKELKKGKKVIFSGCPCQVAGLNAFLGEEYNNLLTIDLICHGQGSPTVFFECIKNLSAYFGEEIKQYQFRSKRKRYEKDYLSLVKTNKATHYIIKEPYMQLFLSQNALRPSCGKNCKYRDAHRPGDLTIADLKGLTDIFPDQIFPKKNWSTIVSNTAKGEECLQRLFSTMEIRPITIEQVVAYNPLFAKQTRFSKERDAFFADYKRNPAKAISKWTVPATEYKLSIAKTIFGRIPRFLQCALFAIHSVFKSR